VRHCDPAPSSPLAPLLHDNSVPSREVRRHAKLHTVSAQLDRSCPLSLAIKVEAFVWSTKRAYRSGRNRRLQGSTGVPGLSSFFTSRHWRQQETSFRPESFSVLEDWQAKL
jgi:hypothetical protein